MFKDRPFMSMLVTIGGIFLGYNGLMKFRHSAQFNDMPLKTPEVAVQELFGMPVGGFLCAEGMTPEQAAYCNERVTLVREYRYCLVRLVCPGSMFVGYDDSGEAAFKFQTN
jgi:hypothetical protein